MSLTPPTCVLAGLEAEVRPEGALSVASRAPVSVSSCRKCDGNAHVPIVRDGYRYAVPCEGASIDGRIERFNQARIPARYADADIASFELRDGHYAEVVDGLTSYLDGFEPGQLGRLWAGPVGSGKTHLMIAVLRVLTLEKGIACRYVEFSHLLASLRELYGQNRSEAEILAPLAQVPVLAIDELGKGRRSDFELRIIDELISRRYNDSSVTTFFASNYYPSRARRDDGGNAGREYLGDRVGARSESRIFEMCELIYLEAEDYRVKLYQSR